MSVPQVAASEHDLIMMARAFVAPRQHDAWTRLCRSRQLPPTIGSTCAMLVQETLSHVWPELWRRSGGRSSNSVIDGRAVAGRGWERRVPVALEFSVATLKLLRWLIATPLTAAPSTVAPLLETSLTIGDQVVIYLALDAATGTAAQPVLARQPQVRAAPLAWLGFAHLLGDPVPQRSLGSSTPGPAPQRSLGSSTSGQPDDRGFDSLTHGAGAIVIEALTRELARRWNEVELGKRAMTDPAQLVALGAAQDAVLQAFMIACDKRKRRDLATFVLDAAVPLLARNLSPAPIALDTTASLSARAGARLASGALLRAVAQWQRWNEEHRAIRFIDDEYPAAQLLLRRFEKIGRDGADQLAAWLSDLASLAPTVASATIEGR